MVLALDFFRPLNIFSAKDAARPIPWFFLGETDGQGTLITDPGRPKPNPDWDVDVRDRASGKGPEPRKPGLLSGGVRTPTESSDEISDEMETL